MGGYVGIIGSNVKDFGAVTPSDTLKLAKKTIALAVSGTAGTVSVVTLAGNTVIIPASLLPVGQFVDFAVLKVNATDTTATGIWALYG